MSTTLPTFEVEPLRRYIEDDCGVALRDDEIHLIETRLDGLMLEKGCESLEEFHQLIETAEKHDMSDRLIESLTSRDTEWFRDGHPFVILQEKILPELAAEFEAGKRSSLRIWSAGCSTGQEPYSIAITIHEFCEGQSAFRPEQCSIVATDISPSTLWSALAGRYDRVATGRGLSPDIQERYFERELRTWLVRESVRNIVRFRKFNLQDAPDDLGRFDIVFMRYVMTDFTQNLKEKIFANLPGVLSPSGFLVLGADESPEGLSDAFEALSHAGGPYYRRTA